jgi:hypothetical protein
MTGARVWLTNDSRGYLTTPTDNSGQHFLRVRLFFVVLVEQISTMHHRRLEVIDGVTDMSRQQFVQATDKLLLFGVTQHVIQGDPVIVVFLLTVHDITVGELHTVTTGTIGLKVVSDDHSIEATNVNAVLVGFAARLARLTPNNSFWL